MKIIFTLLAVIAFSGTSFAGGTTKVRSKDHSCSELQDLVQQEGTVHVKGGWFGSIDVHANASACNGVRIFGEPAEAYVTTWKTTDKRFCTAGYSCRPDYNHDND